jgi:hypothetical protein
MEERRKVQRERTLKAGTISFNCAGGIDCRVLQYISGRRLPRGEQPGRHSERFCSRVGYEKFKQTCHVVWRSDTRLGVEFRA